MKSKWNLSLPENSEIPHHIAIIPDGNRRWAKARGMYTLEGHKKGFDAAVEVTEACWEIGVHTVSVWCFSTENWNRSAEEIAYLMKLYELFLKKQIDSAKKEKVKIIHRGRKDRIPKSLASAIAKAEADTAHFTDHVFNICLDYGGKDEITRVVSAIVADKISPDKVDQQLIDKYLNLQNQPYPNPDLIIRSSGEQRLSGFMSWQNAYAEFYFEKDHFPDFNPSKIIDAVIEFNRRHRRFGGN
ncbi:MAG: polyprenyl diphosphate synthase [Candidatus Shapirobacteria bacterium]|jgi:undecaprenyl diphosphate synthase